MLKHLNVRFKLIIGIVITTIILGITALYIYTLNAEVKYLTREMEQEYLKRIEIGSHINNAAYDLYLNLEVYNNSGDETYLNKAEAVLATLHSEVGELESLTSKHPELEDLIALTEEISRDTDSFDTLIEDSKLVLQHIVEARSDITSAGEEISYILRTVIESHEKEIKKKS